MKIIAVDDDGVSLDLLKECLSEGGYEHLTLMSSPTEALNAITNTAIAYDCILLDVEMPEKDGIELCGDIRRLPRYRNTPILMITRNKDRDAVQQAFANGATDYITKPFEFFEVLTRIKVAERLVQERQAAIDSYIAVQNVTARKPETAQMSITRKPDLPLTDEQLQITGKELLSLSVFQNYLEQVTRADGCQINLIALKIRNIDRIFANTGAAEFVKFLKTAAGAITHEFRPEKAFLTHLGNGMFLCATPGIEAFDASVVETGIVRRMERQDLPQVCRKEVPLEIITGAPLELGTTPKLNFKRAVKAATARAEQRDNAIGHVGLSMLAG